MNRESFITILIMHATSNMMLLSIIQDLAHLDNKVNDPFLANLVVSVSPVSPVYRSC